MPVLETLAIISSIASGAAQLAGTGASIYAGKKAEKEAEKAQEWNERIYDDQLRQQTLQNKIQEEAAYSNRASQRFQNALALRTEGRQNTDRWHQYMQNAANKYTDILNNSRALQKQNAAALRNR